MSVPHEKKQSLEQRFADLEAQVATFGERDVMFAKAIDAISARLAEAQIRLQKMAGDE